MALARLEASPLNQVAVMAMASNNKRNQSSEVLLALSHCSSATLQKRLFSKGDDHDKVAQLAPTTTTATDPLRCIQTALLMYSLKRRQQQQQSSAGNFRLVIFLCSLPTAEKGCSRERLILLAGELRQSQAVQADVIVFGQQDEVDAIGGLFQPFVDVLGEGSQLLRVVHQQQQQQQQETFLRTVFSRLRSLQGQGRVVSSTEGELDEDLLMALELSLLKGVDPPAKQKESRKETLVIEKTTAKKSLPEDVKKNKTPPSPPPPPPKVPPLPISSLKRRFLSVCKKSAPDMSKKKAPAAAAAKVKAVCAEQGKSSSPKSGRALPVASSSSSSSSAAEKEAKPKSHLKSRISFASYAAKCNDQAQRNKSIKSDKRTVKRTAFKRGTFTTGSSPKTARTKKQFGSGKSGRSSKRGGGTAAPFTSPTSLRYKHNSWTYRNPNLYYSPKAINSTSSPTKEQTKKKKKVRSAEPKKAKVAVALKHRRAQNISSMINAKLHSINTAYSGKICQNQENSEKTKKKKAEKVGDTKSTQSTKEKSSTASKSEKTAAAPTGKTPKR